MYSLIAVAVHVDNDADDVDARLQKGSKIGRVENLTRGSDLYGTATDERAVYEQLIPAVCLKSSRWRWQGRRSG